MKNTSPLSWLSIVSVVMGLAFSTAWAETVSGAERPLSESESAWERAHKGLRTVREIDVSFVRQAGFEPVRAQDISGWFDESWYQFERFPYGQEGGGLPPDAAMPPLERAALLVDYLEGSLPHARYRIRMGTDFRALDELGQEPLAFIEVVRLDMGSRGDAQSGSDYESSAVREELEGEGAPHVAWRFIFTPVQGMHAQVVAAGRQELSFKQAAKEHCLGQPCFTLQPIEGQAGAWEAIDMPPWVGQDGTPERIWNSAENATVADAVREISEANLGSEYGEPIESLAASEPYFEIVVSKNVNGSAPTLEVVSHQGHLMDDALSDIWYRWVQVDGGPPSWERLVKHRPPMEF